MKYYIDTEFIESFHKPLFGKKRHFIDLISIAIVCEDGREYYAISNEFNPKDADQWVRDNVISKLPPRHVNFYDSPKMRRESLLWKDNARIRQEIYEFFGYKPEWTDYGSDIFSKDTDIQVYAYYADYDWVLLCSLFGRMIDLPNGFPMYCRDLKQLFDERVEAMPPQRIHKADVDDSFPVRVEQIKSCGAYPKQLNEHNALDDARWNKSLHEFIIKRFKS